MPSLEYGSEQIQLLTPMEKVVLAVISQIVKNSGQTRDSLDKNVFTGVTTPGASRLGETAFAASINCAGRSSTLFEKGRRCR
jgi:hypothetical protein